MPNGETLQGWTPEEKEELDDLVRHKLHSRRAKMKRALKGFGQYVRRRESNLPIHNEPFLTNWNLQLLDYSLLYMLR